MRIRSNSGHIKSSRRWNTWPWKRKIEPGSGAECRWPLFKRNRRRISFLQIKYYSSGNAELHFGRRATGIKKSLCNSRQWELLHLLNSQAYQALAVLKELSGRSLKEAPEDRTLPLCWKGRKPFRSAHSAKKYFKPVLSPAFTNSGRREIQFELHPEAYPIISVSAEHIDINVLSLSPLLMHTETLT
ncbi:hypothetical protein V6N13_070819 [Hibiscus sabdariffa]